MTKETTWSKNQENRGYMIGILQTERWTNTANRDDIADQEVAVVVLRALHTMRADTEIVEDPEIMSSGKYSYFDALKWSPAIISSYISV